MDGQTTTPVIGFLGPGTMGAGMVGRLLDTGFEVIIWARNPEKVQPLIERGAQLALSPSDLVQQADIVLGCLLDSAVIREIYLRADGVVETARPGQIFVEHATFEPALAVELAEAFGAKGAYFLDAPVSGGPEGARNGSLVAMVGGDAVTLQSLSGVFGAYCAQIKHAGEPGSGLRLKLINQLLVCIHAVAAAEASALVLRSGIDPRVAHEALMGGWAASTMLDLVLPIACAGDFESKGAFVGGMLEIQRLVAEFTAEVGVESVLLGPVRSVFEATVDSGRGDQALAAMVTHYTEIKT
ncbi:MAG: NAD(P)-dependent oxidoreductase [Lacisediminihabitans sp.]